MRRLWLNFILPVCLFLTLGGFLWRGLGLNPQELPSALVGQKVPQFRIATVEDPSHFIDDSIFKGKITLLNVWATWCVSCQKEHQVWIELNNKLSALNVQLIGLNLHDLLQHSQSWLQQTGNPYQFNFFDEKGQLGIELGVYGTPETYIIDKNGIIRYRHVGPISEAVWNNKILFWIKELR